jgi:hypothetical protein
MTYVSDGGLLVDLGLEILENTLVNHFVGWGVCRAGKC